MKTIGSIHIDQAPLGMMIYNRKNNKYYIADLNKNGNKQWKVCQCSSCLNKDSKMLGGDIMNEVAVPGPKEHSWLHHHAPFYQVFNNYVCVKRDTLGDIRDFFLQMFSPVNYAQNRPPFSFEEPQKENQ